MTIVMTLLFLPFCPFFFSFKRNSEILFAILSGCSLVVMSYNCHEVFIKSFKSFTGVGNVERFIKFYFTVTKNSSTCGQTML